MFYSARNLSSFVHALGLQVRLNLNQFTNEISREILKKKNQSSVCDMVISSCFGSSLQWEMRTNSISEMFEKL